MSGTSAQVRTDLQHAQNRVWELLARSADLNSREGRAAMNRLMALIRGLTEEELAAFERWKHEEATCRRESGHRDTA
ncbi:MAG: hypothetical protein FJX77_04570 [Armatimonadetes bacterium]|nr:hypothetical protein [Armatimonadota bacterium]